MLNDIPIRINRKGVKASDLAFKIFPLQVKHKANHKRQKTCDNKENQNAEKFDIQSKNFETSKMEFRYRRASSSGAARKFPKDFFKNQNIVSCKKNNHSKINMPQFLPSQKKKIIQKIQRQYNMQTLDELLPINNNLRNQNQEQNSEERTLQTPKFNNKNNQKNIQKDLKVKLKQYLNYKKSKIANQLMLHDLQEKPKQELSLQQNIQVNFLETLNPLQQLKKVQKSIKKQEKQSIFRQRQNLTKKINEKQIIFKKLNIMKPFSKFQNQQNENKYKFSQNYQFKDEEKQILTCFRIKKF